MDPPQPPYHEYDILTVNNNGLLDLNSESHELVSHIDLGVEVEAVKRLLTPEFHKPMTHTSQQQAASLEETSKLSKEASSHQSPSRAREIMRENKQLLDRLERIITAKPDINVHNASIEEHDKRIADVMAHSLVKRQREEEKIMQENLWLYHRLQGVKPSKAVDRQSHKQHFHKSRKYLSKLQREPRMTSQQNSPSSELIQPPFTF